MSVFRARVGLSNGRLPITAELSVETGGGQPSRSGYEQALRTLCVKERDDPLTEMIAKKIIKIAKTGIHDPTQIAARVIKELGLP